MGAHRMFQPDDLRPTIEITVFTLTSLSTLVVAIRILCRIWIVKRLKLYDYIMFAAVLCTWGLCACNHYQLAYGTGAHKSPNVRPKTSTEERSDRSNHWVSPIAASWYAYHIGYLADLCFVKLSILVFYLSFATHRTFRILVYISIGFVSVVSVFMIFMQALQCPKEPHIALTKSVFKNPAESGCFDLTIILYWQSGFNTAADLIILILPLPLLLRLKMHTAKRFSLLAVFSVGLLVPVASGIRFWALYLWANAGRQRLYYGGYIIFWSQVEINTAIICASAPSLQPLFIPLFSKISALHRSRDAYHYYGGRHDSSLGSQSDVQDTRRDGPEFMNEVVRPEATHQAVHSESKGRDPPSLMVTKNLTYEDVIRERVRAFSLRPPSWHSQTPSRTTKTSVYSHV